MPTSTARLDLPVPVSTDPANVPLNMLELAGALDAGANANYDGVAVIVSPPAGLGGIPSNPVIGTIYPVSGSPPYLLYYTGENTAGTGTAPTGWRLVGQAGTNTANISNTNPGNSANPGVQPVWAPLDHTHASLPWSANQTTPAYTGIATSDGVAYAFARADHAHAPTLSSGLLGSTSVMTIPPGGYNLAGTGDVYENVPTLGSISLTTGTMALVFITAQLQSAATVAGGLAVGVSGATTISYPQSPANPAFFLASDIPQTISGIYPVTLTAGTNTFSLGIFTSASLIIEGLCFGVLLFGGV